MSGLVLLSALIMIYGFYMFFFWRSTRKNRTSSAATQRIPDAGFEGEHEIVHARLAHFPSQIGHWSISSMEIKHKQEGSAMMFRNAIRLLLIGVVLFNVSKAQQSTPLAVSGFVDAYYSRNFNQPANRSDKLRNFDVLDNQVNLSLVEVVLQKKSEPIGFRIDADFGTANDMVQGIAPYGTTSYNTLTNIQQAYLTGVIPIGAGLTVDAGKFVTHMGYEVIESKDNWNYSRSLLFAWAIPYYHTGIRLTYPIASNFTAALHVVNNWNSTIDNNDFKSLGLALNYAVTSSTTFTLNVMDGVEESNPNIAGKKTVFDLILTHQFTDAFALTLNGDYGDERTFGGLATWKGVAAYGRYAIDTVSAVAVRLEIFDDPLGYATALNVPKLDVKEVTATYEYKFSNSLLLRAEARYDLANAKIFDKKANVNSQSNQPTLLVGAVVMF